MNDRCRILIIKLAALGDAVMASTTLPALRERWPNARITWLCGRGIAPLIHCFEGVDEVVPLDERRLLAGSLVVKAASLAVAMAGLAGRAYDLCLVAHKDWRYRLIPLAARCRTVRALGGRNGPVPGRWHGDEYRRLALGEDGPFTASAPLATLRGAAAQSPAMGGAPPPRSCWCQGEPATSCATTTSAAGPSGTIGSLPHRCWHRECP